MNYILLVVLVLLTLLSFGGERLSKWVQELEERVDRLEKRQ